MTPQSDRLTAALTAPVADVPVDGWRRALDDARDALAALAAPAAGPRGGPWRVTGHAVRTAFDAACLHGDGAFAWSARTARRPLGLAAVRALLAGEAGSPAEAVRARVASATGLVRDGAPVASAPASLDRWLAGLSPAGRAAAGAEAVTWATRLWCGVDWDAVDGPVVIGRDHWWDSPHSPLLAIRSRAEVRSPSAHLVVLSGPRRASVRTELALVMLVEALRSRGSAPPGRVLGWWPESGLVVRVEPEPAVLALGAAAVAQVTGRGRLPSGRRAA